jgi:hypothetical protein
MRQETHSCCQLPAQSAGESKLVCWLLLEESGLLALWSRLPLPLVSQPVCGAGGWVGWGAQGGSGGEGRGGGGKSWRRRGRGERALLGKGARCLTGATGQ